MPPSWIIEPIDILEYRPFSLASGFPAVAPDQLCFERFEEGLDHGIVVAVALTAHPLPGSACLHAREGILESHVLTYASDTRWNSIAIHDPYDECSPSVVALGRRPYPVLGWPDRVSSGR